MWRAAVGRTKNQVCGVVERGGRPGTVGMVCIFAL